MAYYRIDPRQIMFTEARVGIAELIDPDQGNSPLD